MTFYDPFEEIRKQHEHLNRIINPPALKAIQENMKMINDISRVVQDTGIYQNSFALNRNIDWINNLKIEHSIIDTISPFREIINNFENSKHIYSKSFMTDVSVPISIFNNLFNDVTFDAIDGIEDILNFVNSNPLPIYQDGNSEIYSEITVNTNNSVMEMTREELRDEILNAFQTAQSNVNIAMAPKERLRTFINDLLTSIGQDMAKYVAKAIFYILLVCMIQIASNNHDLDVAQQISEKISETEIATSVKRAFKKNPEIDKPTGDMAFLHVDTKLRTRPTKESALVSKDPISKNTVVIPIVRKGNWVLVEVETKDEYYTGWVQQSRLISFKLD